MKRFSHKFLQRRGLLSVLIVFVVTLSSFVFFDGVKAQNGESPKWLVNCSNNIDPASLNCSMMHSIVHKESKRQLVLATMFFDKERSLFMRFKMPHGIELTKGIVLSIDKGRSFSGSIIRSDRTGTYSRMQVSDEFLTAMKRGNVMKLAMYSSDGSLIEVHLSLVGFAAGYDLMSKSLNS